MNKQPEALRLADLLEYDAINHVGYHKPLVCASAAELRRLHSTCEELGEMVKRLTEGALATAQRTKELEANNAELLAALTICVCAMQDYQAGIGITEMFDRGERLGRAAIAKAEEVK